LVRDDHFGITFRSARRASRSSRIKLRRCLWHVVPKSFKLNSDIVVQMARGVFAGEELLHSRTMSTLAETRSGRKRSKRPKVVWTTCGVRSSLVDVGYITCER
jgi:hypothetical protein